MTFNQHLGVIAVVALAMGPPWPRNNRRCARSFLERHSESVGILTYHQWLRCARWRVLRVSGLHCRP